MTRIELPEWARQPETELDGVSKAQHQAIQQSHNKFLQVVHKEVLTYMNNPVLCVLETLMVFQIVAT